MKDDELRPYASSPCYQHELEPQYQDDINAGNRASVRQWRWQRRKQLIERRRALVGNALNQASADIICALEKEPLLFCDSVAFYWPMEGEIDLRPLMRTMLGRDTRVALPVIVEKNAPLEFWEWDERTTMKSHGVWNIPAPVERNVIYPGVLLIPLLGFDDQGQRLGHGGGYYDRTLASLDPRPVAIGIGGEFGRLPSIYPQTHDIAMDAIVTEKGVVWHRRK